MSQKEHLSIGRRIRQQLDQKYRWITRHQRALPDFIITGAQKAGTSSLFSCLRQHPQIIPSCTKEVHFFDGGLHPEKDAYRNGPDWYRSFFPIKNQVLLGQKTFEASPMYLFHPLAAERIQSLIPGAKLIFILRDPSARAISHYFHETRKGMEPLSLPEALQSEEVRLTSAFRDKNYKNHSFIHHSYKARGRYLEQIERFLKFFPREQLLFLNSEKFFQDPVASLKTVFEFTGVDPDFIPPRLTPRHVAKNRTDVDPAVYAGLNEYFRPYNRALFHFLGEDLGWPS